MPTTPAPHRARFARAPRLALAALLTLSTGLAVACSGGGDTSSESATFDAATGSAGAPPSAPVAVRKAAPDAQGEERAPAATQAAAAPGTSAQPGSVAASAMLIRTGAASVEVRDVDAAIAQLRQLATRLGGYVANSSLQGGADQVRSATLELKIPAQRFDEAINGLAPLGEVENVGVNAEDVGEEFTDVTARVQNARRLEERLIALLAQRTGKLEDVLAVERELARVREEIERHEGRLRYLQSRVAVSTLSVTVHEPYPLVGGRPGVSPIADAFRQAWRNFVSFVAGFIASLGILVPLGLIVAVLVWGARRLLGPQLWGGKRASAREAGGRKPDAEG